MGRGRRSTLYIRGRGEGCRGGVGRGGARGRRSTLYIRGRGHGCRGWGGEG